MSKLSKRRRAMRSKIDVTKAYDVNEAIILLKELKSPNFIESIDVSVNLGINPKKSDQNIRGATILPHGTGKLTRIAVFAQGISAREAEDAGADLVGMDDLVEKIKQGEINFDVAIAAPDAMTIVSQIGQILGPRGLMPNPKMGTITSNIAEAVRKAKSGQVRYRNDKNGIIHTSIGKVNFEVIQLIENLDALLKNLQTVKPVHTKGIYFKKVSLSTTMGPAINIDRTSLNVLSN
ncbi:50S ribosomal protein L1 [Candidatus Ishikawella capsulata]|nr:50S ribosomal protein L1 [Candidatus Ishikawaella capsulata]